MTLRGALRASPRLRGALLLWAAWSGVALLFLLSVMLPSPAAGDPGEWARALSWQLVSWWTWALWTPLVVEVMNRSVGLRPAWKLVLVHGTAGVVIAGLCTATQGILRWVAFSGIRIRYDIAGASSLPLADEWSLNLVVYAMAVGGCYVLRAARLEAQLAQSRLATLSARVRPHFLFNTLNTIQALVPENPGAANRMIAQLSELLRQAFDRGDQAEVMLHEELRLIGHYVAIQEQRFGDRLHVTLHADPHAEGALVPALLLQPLVENAVTHGLAGRAGGRVSVRVHGTVAGGRLRLVVRDDGPGFGRGLGGPGRPYGLKRLDAPETREGVGLAGTRARLQERYGSAHRLDLTDAPGGGAEVMVEIPFVTHAGADR